VHDGAGDRVQAVRGAQQLGLGLEEAAGDEGGAFDAGEG